MNKKNLLFLLLMLIGWIPVVAQIQDPVQFKSEWQSLLKKSTSDKKFWRDGRVVDRGGLENRCTERYRGFESLSLRKRNVKYLNVPFFIIFVV